MKEFEIKTSKGIFIMVDDKDLNAISGQTLVDKYGGYEYLKTTTKVP